jgi:hypothetical protein
MFQHSAALWIPQINTIKCLNRLLCSDYYYFYHLYVCMYVCVRGGPNQPLHRDPQWSIVLPLL